MNYYDVMQRLAMKSFAVILVLVSMATVSSVHAACSTDLSPYKPCLPAVMGTTPPSPTKECCIAVKSADILCLCEAVGTTELPGLNKEAALTLPQRCGAVAFSTRVCGSK